MTVLWEPTLAGDAYGKIPTSFFDDPRVTSYWDPDGVSGTWLGQLAVHGLTGLVWDAYYAFAPGAEWGRDGLTGVVAADAPIIGATGALEREFLPLLDERRSAA